MSARGVGEGLVDVSEYIFSTARLGARKIGAKEANFLFEVYSDPEVIKWVGDGNPITYEQCERWVDVCKKNYTTRGYGMFLIEGKDSGEPIGFGGIVHPGDQVEPEIKYALQKKHWKNGYGSELVRGLIQFATEKMQKDHLIATVHPDNKASIKVLEKSRFRLAEKRTNEDQSITLVFKYSV